MINIDSLLDEILKEFSPVKVSLGEAWRILQLIIAKLVTKLDIIGTALKGLEKKEIAIEVINKVYDTIFLVVDIPVVPNALEPIIHRYVKQLLMVMVSSSIDATVTIFKQTGIISNKPKERVDEK
jgi:aspartokinase